MGYKKYRKLEWQVEKNKGECTKNVTSHEQKETNMKNEVAEIGNSEKSEI